MVPPQNTAWEDCPRKSTRLASIAHPFLKVGFFGSRIRNPLTTKLYW